MLTEVFKANIVAEGVGGGGASITTHEDGKGVAAKHLIKLEFERN